MSTTIAKLQAIVECDTSGAEGNLKRFSGSMKQSESGLTQINNALGAIGLGVSFAALAAGAIGLGKQIVGLGMEAETTAVAFKTMMGGTEQATAMLDKLRQFAATTPFQFTELQQSTKLMLAFGFSAESVIPTLTAVGDAASGLSLGAEGVNRVIIALGQMQAKGRVGAEEMMRFTEAGIPAWKYLAEAMGVSTAEVMKLSEKGLIPVGKAMAAITAGMEKDFGGLMAAQSKTAAGQLSNLEDQLVATGVTIGTDFLPAVKEVISTLGKAATSFDLIYNWQRRIRDGVIETEAAVRDTSKTWEEYIDKQSMVAVAAGDMDARQRQDLITMIQTGQQVSATGWTLDDLATSYGLATKATWEQDRAVKVFVGDHKELNQTSQKLAEQFAIQADAQRVASVATQTLADNWQGLGLAWMKSKGHADELRMSEAELSNTMSVLRSNMAGAIGQEMASYGLAQGTLAEEAQKLNDEIAKLSATQGMAYGPSSDLANTQLQLANAQFDAETSAIKLAAAQTALSENTDPDKQRQLQGAVLDAQIAIIGTAGKVGEYDAAVRGASGGVVDHQAKLDELKTKLGEINTELQTNLEAHQRKTKQAIFDMLEEAIVRENTRAGAKAMTDEQVLGLQKLALEWGLVDKATADANAAIIKGVGEASASGDWAKLWGNQSSTTTGMDDIFRATAGVKDIIPSTVDTALAAQWDALRGEQSGIETGMDNVTSATDTAGTEIITAMGEASASDNWALLAGKQATTTTGMATMETATDKAGKEVVSAVTESADLAAWSKVWANQATTTANFDAVTAAANRIPRVIDVVINVHQNGAIETPSGPPGRASGGPVSAGTMYLVGERGPELFVPPSSGNIIPNHKLDGGGGKGGMTINLTANYAAQKPVTLAQDVRRLQMLGASL